MENIVNTNKKLVCRLDREKKLIEIKKNKMITTICFKDNGGVEIKNIEKSN